MIDRELNQDIESQKLNCHTDKKRLNRNVISHSLNQSYDYDISPAHTVQTFNQNTDIEIDNYSHKDMWSNDLVIDNSPAMKPIQRYNQ